MLMQQVRKVMTVNQEMTDESSWIWLTSEQMGFSLRSEFANENQTVQAAKEGQQPLQLPTTQSGGTCHGMTACTLHKSQKASSSLSCLTKKVT